MIHTKIYGNGGVPDLRARLGSLGIEELKDIVAEHGMDRSKLAMKWKAPDRLVDLIVDTVQQRAHKGEAFTVCATRVSGGGRGDPTPTQPLNMSAGWEGVGPAWPKQEGRWYATASPCQPNPDKG